MSSLFCEFVFENDLRQLVTEPTHKKGNILDLILVNRRDIIQEVKVCSENIPFSMDHCIISCNLKQHLHITLTVALAMYNYIQLLQG